MAASPTQRSLEYLRKSGCQLVAVVERWNMHAKIRQDLFGIIDVLAIGVDDAIIAVQSTSASNVASRITKMAESDSLPIILKAGIKVYVHGWKKGSNGRWQLREVELS